MIECNFECLFQDLKFDFDVTIDRMPEKIDNDHWCPIRVDYKFDSGKEAETLFLILCKYYALGSEFFDLMISSKPKDVFEQFSNKFGTGRIKKDNDSWELIGLWPHIVDFGELCYSSSPEIEIGIVWRYFYAIPNNS